MSASPDTAQGRFGAYGGRYVPETLVPALDELAREYAAAWADPGFQETFNGYLRHYAGRETPLTEAKRLSDELGMHVAIKREDLAHTGAHKINNALGQCLLAVLRLGYVVYSDMPEKLPDYRAHGSLVIDHEDADGSFIIADHSMLSWYRRRLKWRPPSSLDYRNNW